VLVVLLFTGGAGITLLAGALAHGRAPEPSPVPAPTRKADPFAPPSLVRSQTQALPWGRALLEFTHPALAIVGGGMWIGYTVTHQKAIGAVGAGVLAGAAIAGLSWFAANKRTGSLSFGRRVLIAHTAGAVLALVLIAVAVAIG